MNLKPHDVSFDSELKYKMSTYFYLRARKKQKTIPALE